ncbi:MAG: PQQ-binding-like beta-propeller repeat protein [Dehalococcoidia bacterium]
MAWGSEEQFEAELRPSWRTGEISWPTRMAVPYPVTFEVPANATKASLFFAEHKIPLNLQDSQKPFPEEREPSPAPVPGPNPNAPPGAEEYFLGNEYGIAITSLSRRPSDRFPTWTRVTLELAVMTFRDDPTLAPPIKIRAGQDKICFSGENKDDCIRIKWGPEKQFHAYLFSSITTFDVKWPRGKGWPELHMDFEVPEDTENATLLFGEHRIQLDTLGMVGSVPAWNYRLHYPELAIGSVLYDFNSKTISLAEVKQHRESGNIVLNFSAENNSEVADFVPSISASATRVTRNGLLLDDKGNGTLGWVPTSVNAQGRKLAPGEAGYFTLVLPRVSGKGFPRISLAPPDVTILQLKATDAETEAGTTVAPPAYVAFERSDGEAQFWEPFLGKVIWKFKTDGRVSVSPVVADGVVYVHSESSDKVYALDALTGRRVPESTPVTFTSPPKEWQGVTPSGRPIVITVGPLGWLATDLVAREPYKRGNIWVIRFKHDVTSGLTVVGGVAYVGTDSVGIDSLISSPGHVYAVDIETGRELWSFDTGEYGRVASTPTVADGVVYFGSQDYHLYALDAATGHLIWKYRTSDSVYSSPTVASSIVYVGSDDYHIYALLASPPREAKAE